VIYRTEAFFWPARIIYNSFVIGILIAAAQVCAFAAGSVTLTWIPSTDTNVVGYNVYYGGTSGDYTNKISTANTTNTVVSGLTQGVTYYFVVTAYDSSGLESPFSNQASYAIPLGVTNNAATTNNVVIGNTPPTLNVIGNLVIDENAGEQTVDLSGISSGVVSGKQTVKITAATSKSDLIPKPKISYTSANPTGILTFTPKKNAIGTATITVTINNGEKDNNIVIRTFAVTILAKGSATPTPATLTPAICAKGQFALTVSGLSGQKYIVEASTNLVNWIPVWTNTAPCTYTDVNAGQFSQRFYRSVPAP
jgi:hypothetical protein